MDSTESSAPTPLPPRSTAHYAPVSNESPGLRHNKTAQRSFEVPTLCFNAAPNLCEQCSAGALLTDVEGRTAPREHCSQTLTAALPTSPSARLHRITSQPASDPNNVLHSEDSPRIFQQSVRQVYSLVMLPAQVRPYHRRRQLSGRAQPVLTAGTAARTLNAHAGWWL